MKKHRINELTKKEFENKFLKEHGFIHYDYSDEVEEIVYDYGSKEEKNQYNEYLYVEDKEVAPK